MNQPIVSVEWLNEHLNDPDLILLDASPKKNMAGITASLNNRHIPNTRLVDLKKDFTEKKSAFPNTVPSAAQFEAASRRLGISNSSRIVVYDNLGIYTSPRVWWLFKIMGHKQVYVLDGGLKEWIRKGYKTVSETALPKEIKLGNFKSQFQKNYIKIYQDVIQNIEDPSFLLVDARSEGRFKGIAPEPRKHLQSGCIPNSINIPYTELLDDGKFKSKDALKEIFTKKITSSLDLAFSCGSGMTACIVMLARQIAFQENWYLYDGSWSEYAVLQGLAKADKL